MNRTDRTAKDADYRERQYDDFVVLLAKHDQTLRRYVRALLPSSDGLDDVIQETALECWKKYRDFQPADPQSASDEFVRWACVIARFKTLSWQRDKAREKLVFRESVVELLSRDVLSELGRNAEERVAVEACLDKLPTDQRRLVLSVHAPGESVAQIAAETGVKARRLYSKINALRSILLECVQRQLAEECTHG